MSLTTLAPCKAQKPVEFIAETGISGFIKKDANFYTGMNFGIPKGKNYTDLYAGISVQPDKKASFVGLAINDYAWNKNISSWGRGTFVASDRAANATWELAPVRVNKSVKKFNFSFSPSYALYNDFKAGTTTQGLSFIPQITYSPTKRNTFFLEMKYSTEPAKNLFKTHFGSPKDNMFYMFSYMTKF